MRRIAAGILLAGFVFIFFRVPVLGIDILIDAVGFLLLFNGARALQKMERAEAALCAPDLFTPPAFAFGAAQPIAIALVALSAAQLFAGAVTGLGSGGGIVGIARGVLEILLFACLLRGLLPLLKRQGRRALGWALPAALALDMAASLLSVVGIFVLAAQPLPFLAFVTVFSISAHLFTAAVFIWLLAAVRDGALPQGRR